jgi:hypothetical protein
MRTFIVSVVGVGGRVLRVCAACELGHERARLGLGGQGCSPCHAKARTRVPCMRLPQQLGAPVIDWLIDGVCALVWA